MSLTFKQWYDSKSPEAQGYIAAQCEEWIDLTSKDYYQPVKQGLTIDEITGKESDWRNREIFGICLLTQNPKTTLEDYKEYYKREYGEISFQSLRFLPVEQRKAIVKENTNRSYGSNGLNFSRWLFSIDDYSKLNENMDTLDLSNSTPDDRMMEILGEDAAIEYIRKNERAFELDSLPKTGRSKIFDKLFFCPDGWTEEQKHKIMRRFADSIRYYRNRESSMDTVLNIIRHVALVNKADLIYVYDVICKLPELAQHLYDLKKPEEELTGNETMEGKYRFPMWLRKLFLIMGCCARENISQANTQKLQKEGASLLRMYNFHFKDYFDAYLMQSPDY